MTTALRGVRHSLTLTQLEFATGLAVPFHSFRMRDSGLQATPTKVLLAAQE